MGVQFFFDEVVTSVRSASSDKFKCTVEVADDHLIPEVRIGPEGAAYKGMIAQFDDWDQFTRFVEAVDSLYTRLEGLHAKK